VDTASECAQAFRELVSDMRAREILIIAAGVPDYAAYRQSVGVIAATSDMLGWINEIIRKAGDE
jgi:hypothetical protein